MSGISRKDSRLQEKTKSLILTPPLPTQDRSPPRAYMVSHTSHNQNSYESSHSPQFKITPNPLIRLYKSSGKSTSQSFCSDIKTSPWNQTQEVKDEKKRTLTPTSRQNFSINSSDAKRETEELKQTILKMHQDLVEKERNLEKIEGEFSNQKKQLLNKLEEQAQAFQEERRDLQQELNKNGEERRRIFLELTTKLRNIEAENSILKQNIVHIQPFNNDQVTRLNTQVSQLEEQIIKLQQTQLQAVQLEKQDKPLGLKEQPSQIGRETTGQQLDTENLIRKIQSDMEKIKTDIQNSSSVDSSKSTCVDIYDKIASVISPLFHSKLAIISQDISGQQQVEGVSTILDIENQKEVTRQKQLFLIQKEEYELQISNLKEQCESLKRDNQDLTNKSQQLQQTDQIEYSRDKLFSSANGRKLIRESNQNSVEGHVMSSIRDDQVNNEANERSQQKSIQTQSGLELNESGMQQQFEIYLQQMRKNVQQLAKLEGIVADLQTAIKKKESECEEKNKAIMILQGQLGVNSKFRSLVKSFVESLQKGTKIQVEESLRQIQQNSVQDYDQLRNLSTQVLSDREELRRLQNNSNNLSDSANKKRQEGREKELEDALRQQEIFLLQFQQAKKQQDVEKEAAAKNIISLTQSLRKAQQNISILTQQNQVLQQDKQQQQQQLHQQSAKNLIQQSLKSSINNINSNDISQVISDMPLPDSPKILTAHQHSKQKSSNPLRAESDREINDKDIQKKLFQSEGQEEHYKLRCQELEKLLEGQNYAETLNDFAKREISLKKEIEELKEECIFWKEEHQQCQQEVVNLTYNVEAIKNQLACANSIYKGEDLEGRIAILANENNQLIQTKNKLQQQQQQQSQFENSQQSKQESQGNTSQQQRNQQSLQLNYVSEQVQRVSQFQTTPLARSEGATLRNYQSYESNNYQNIQSTHEAIMVTEEMKKQIEQLTSERDSLKKKVEKLSITSRQPQGDPSEEINKRMCQLSQANEKLANENAHLNSKYRPLRDKISSLVSLATGLQELTSSCENCCQLKASITAGAKELAM